MGTVGGWSDDEGEWLLDGFRPLVGEAGGKVPELGWGGGRGGGSSKGGGERYGSVMLEGDEGALNWLFLLHSSPM